MVEMAAILPVLLILVLGIVEFGRAFTLQELVISAAREGARRAAVPDAEATDVSSAVQKILDSGSISANFVTTTISVTGQGSSLSTAKRGDTVAVQVTVPYSKMALFSPKFLTGSSVLNASCSMRKE